MTLLLMTGTDSASGTTVAAAALAACARGHATVVALAQVGLPAAVETVTRLAGVRDVHEFARYPSPPAAPSPPAPHRAARESGLPELGLAETVRQLVDLDAEHDDPQDLVLVLGAGTLLTPYTATDRWTLADLGAAVRAAALVVTRVGPDAAGHAALVTGRLAEDGIPLAGVVLTGWPPAPDAVAHAVVEDLAELAPDGEPAAVLPADLADGRDFARRARAAVAPRFGGTFDWPGFRASLPA